MKLRVARLRALREDRELTPGQLAYKAGISRDYIYLLEKERRPNVSGAIIAELARALNTSSDYLYGLTDDSRPLPLASSNPIPADVKEVAYRIQQLSHPVRERLIHTIVSMIEMTEAVEEEMRREEG